MCRAVGVGLTWLLGFLVTGYAALPDPRTVQPITRTAAVRIPRLAVEADARARFVQQKANQPWIGLAMDAPTRPSIAFHVGDRRRKSAKNLGAKIPPAYREQATLHPEQYVGYTGVIPAA